MFIFTDAFFVNEILHKLPKQFVPKIFTINKMFYDCGLKYYRRIKHEAINNADECIRLYGKYEDIRQPDMLSTICFEMITYHSFFLHLNWKGFTTKLIDDINNCIRICVDDPKYVLMIPELNTHRSNLILTCHKYTDLYRYTVKELKFILKTSNHRHVHSLTKNQLVDYIKRYEYL